jgi:hypothetical protein
VGRCFLPRDLEELYAHALAAEREAARRFTELERYMRNAREALALATRAAHANGGDVLPLKP